MKNKITVSVEFGVFSSQANPVCDFKLKKPILSLSILDLNNTFGGFV